MIVANGLAALAAEVPPAAWGALVTVCVGFFLNKKSTDRDLRLKEQTAQLNRLIAAEASDARTMDARAAATFRYVDILVERQKSLQADISTLIALLDLNRHEPGPFPRQVQEKAFSLCTSISMHVFPSGPFDEELNLQLGHVAAFFGSGARYWDTRPDFYVAFRRNCWVLVRAESARIEESIMTGTLAGRVLPTPWTIGATAPVRASPVA